MKRRFLVLLAGSCAAAHGVPVIGGNSAELSFLTNPDFFTVGGNLLSGYYGEVALARQNGPKIANIYCAEDPACAATTTLVTGFGKPLGVRIGYTSKVAATQPDFTATCQGIKASGDSSYALGLNSATILLMVAQCGQQGVKAKPVGSCVTTSAFASTPGLDGMESADPVFPFFDDSTPATQEFQAALKKYAPSVGTATEPMTPVVANAWVSGELFRPRSRPAAPARSRRPASRKASTPSRARRSAASRRLSPSRRESRPWITATTNTPSRAKNSPRCTG
jgi:branched-chain amino acid transport system substrate-binding protein